MLQTVGEGAERLLCTPHAQPWPAAWTHGKGVVGHTLGRRRETLPNKGRFSELFGASYLTAAEEKVILCGGFVSGSGTELWGPEISQSCDQPYIEN